MAAGDLTATVATLGDLPCAVFDGVDDYVEVPHSPRQLGANLANGFTISAWINPATKGEGTTDAGSIIRKQSQNATPTGGFTFALRSTELNNITFYTNSTASKVSGAGGEVVVGSGNWYHVLATCTYAGSATIYVNGTAVAGPASVGGDLSTLTSTNSCSIGNNSKDVDTDKTFDGGIREVKMWDKVLSATEIADDYNKGGFIAKDNLIHYFKLGTDYADYGQVGVAGTNSGSYFTKTTRLDVKANVNTLNLPAVTDKLKIIPLSIRDNGFKVIGVARAA